MALPAIMRRLFAGDGYGPLLRDDIISRRISIQDWSSTFDYQSAIAVRGSDGKPYWSVAASGPNSGGAANPVNDDGSHWVSLPSMADIAAMNYATQSWVTGQNYATQGWVGGQNYAARPSLFENSGFGPLLKPEILRLTTDLFSYDANTVASSKWVKDLASSVFYVDASVSSSGDGHSWETAFKTIHEAADQVGVYCPHRVFIYVAGGTYQNENVNLYAKKAVIHFVGSTTVYGRFIVADGGVMTLEGSSGAALTIDYTGVSGSGDNRPITVANGAFAFLNIPTTLLLRGSLNFAVLCDANAGLVVIQSLSITSFTSLSDPVLGVAENSFLYFTGALSFSANPTDLSIHTFASAVRSSDIVFTNCTLTYGSTNTIYGLISEDTSFFYIQASNIYINAKTTILAKNNSCFRIYNSTLKLWSTRDCVVYISSCSSVILENCTSLFNSSTQIPRIISVFRSSSFVADSGSLTVGGSVTSAVLECSYASNLFIYDNCSYTANQGGMSGRKWVVRRLSDIVVNGRILENLPGDLPGVTESASYGYIA